MSHARADLLETLSTTTLASLSPNDYDTRMKVDKILQEIHALKEDIQSHAVMQEVRWKLLESLGVCEHRRG